MINDDFQALLRGYLVSRGMDPSDVVAADDYLLNAGGRVVQLRLGDGGTMRLSTMVFYNEGMADRVLAVPIAEFNAFHLFAGGYCLLVDEPSGSLYVEQELAVGRFDAGGLRRHLEDFSTRATSCARWYLEELTRHEEGTVT